MVRGVYIFIVLCASTSTALGQAQHPQRPQRAVTIVAPAHTINAGLSGTLMDVLSDSTVAPRDGSVSISLIVFDDSMYCTHTNQNEQHISNPIVVLHPTVLTDDTLADILGSLRLPDMDNSQGNTLESPSFDLADAMTLAGTMDHSLSSDGAGHMLVLIDALPIDDSDIPLQIRTARDAALGTEEVYSIHALGPKNRPFMRDFITGSDAQFPTSWSTNGVLSKERNLGMAAQHGESNPTDVLVLMLRRIMHRPGDYDLDGVVEVSFTASCNGSFSGEPSGDDWDQFLADVTAQDPYADWNFDTSFNGDVRPPIQMVPDDFGVDFSKFITEVLGGCP